MKDLMNIEEKGLTIDSREIAEMIGTEHWKLLRKLEGTKDGKSKGYVQTFNDNKIVVADYFIKSEYLDLKGEKRPCYLFTKMGCEFIANKFTGEKGILFTAKYVKRFNDMENYIKSDQVSLLKSEISDYVKNEIQKVASEGSLNFRPSAYTKFNVVKYIKNRLGIEKANLDYEMVKERVFIILNARKWEDIPYETLKNSMSIIDESIEVIKKSNNINQMSFFENSKFHKA